MSLANELVEAVSAWPEVEAITLGGSRATGDNDEKSDYDVYVYVTAPVSAERRRRLLRNYCSHMEIDNDFWETEDDCTLNDGTNIDVLYRDLDQFAANVADVVERFQASNGYTTCMWHNMLTSKVLFDRDGQYAATRQRFDVPFPEELRRNIINRNMRLLTGNLPSYGIVFRCAVRAEPPHTPRREASRQARRTRLCHSAEGFPQVHRYAVRFDVHRSSGVQRDFGRNR